MSGGHFDYAQYRLGDIADEIDNLIRDNNSEYRQYSEETLSKFRKSAWMLRVATVYVQRIDWLVSADDSEETFHARLIEDLENINDQT